MQTEGKSHMPHLFPLERSHTSPEEVWTTAFENLSQRIVDTFVRQSSHQRALAYLQGLMSPVARKTGGRRSGRRNALRDATPVSVIYWLKKTVFQITCHAPKRFQRIRSLA